MKTNYQRGILPIVIIIIAAIVIGGGTAVIIKKNNDDKAAKMKLEQQAAENLNATSTASTATSTERTIQFALKEQNQSGQSGHVVITEVNGKAKVIVTLTGKPSTVLQPSHIHLNSCANIGGVKYPLTAVNKGAAQTIIDVSLDSLLKSLPLSLNIHKSEAQAGIYVACGDFPATTTLKLKDTATTSVKTNATSTIKVNNKASTSVDVHVDVNGHTY